MNEVLKTISERYSCRGYTGIPVPDDQLLAIADSALCSPSAMGLAPWHIVIVKDTNLIAEMDRYGLEYLHRNDTAVYERFMTRGGDLFYGAPRMIVVAARPDDSGQISEIDCGIVAQNIALAATSLGVANVICGIAAVCFTGDGKQYFEDKLSFPAGYQFGISVLLGYEKLPGKAHTPDLSKITIVE